MPEPINVCYSTFRDGTKEELRGFVDGSVDEGVMSFQWEDSQSIYPLDTIKCAVTMREEE